MIDHRIQIQRDDKLQNLAKSLDETVQKLGLLTQSAPQVKKDNVKIITPEEALKELQALGL